MPLSTPLPPRKTIKTFRRFAGIPSRGPIISTEEQRVWQAIRRHWTHLAEHGMGNRD